jgi:phospholipase/carboxylesterase
MPLQAIHRPAALSHNPRLLIGLHGWGANKEDLAALADYLNLPGYAMAFPDAPFSHAYNPVGRMWYDFPRGYDFLQPHDFEQQTDLQESRQQLHAWIEQITTDLGVPLSQTVLAGFSQGGAMALDVGLPLPLAGILVLSGYLHSPGKPHQPASPVLMVHGRQDPTVPIRRARQAYDMLSAQGITVTYHELDMGHEIQPEVLIYIEQFCTALPESACPVIESKRFFEHPDGLKEG